MTRIYWIIALALIAVTFAASVWVAPGLPDRIPTHWNIEGEVDGYGGKWTLFLMPAIMVPLLGLFYFMPALSPKHFEVDTFRSTYLYIMVVTFGLFAYLQAVLLYAVYEFVHGDRSFDLGRAFMVGIFLSFAMMGYVMGRVRKNFFIGIRVPWTLASERVWNDTHRLGAWVMTTTGVIGVALTILGMPMWVSIAVLIGSMMIPILYSFLHYKALERAGQLEP